MKSIRGRLPVPAQQDEPQTQPGAAVTSNGNPDSVQEDHADRSDPGSFLDVELQSSWNRSVDAVVNRHKRAWLADIAIGGVIGGVIGAIVAVNLVIYMGIEGGYEATIPDVFRQNVIVGVITVAMLVGGPLLGVVVARRLRRRRAGSRNQ